MTSKKINNKTNTKNLPYEEHENCHLLTKVGIAHATHSHFTVLEQPYLICLRTACVTFGPHPTQIRHVRHVQPMHEPMISYPLSHPYKIPLNAKATRAYFRSASIVGTLSPTRIAKSMSLIFLMSVFPRFY